jgi:hypothetical protein
MKGHAIDRGTATPHAERFPFARSPLPAPRSCLAGWRRDLLPSPYSLLPVR